MGILKLIVKTPLVEINKINPHKNVRILAKLGGRIQGDPSKIGQPSIW